MEKLLGHNRQKNTKRDDENITPLYSATGIHCLADFFECRHLDDLTYIEQSFKAAAKICGATILGSNFHKFGGEGGVTGVLLLAESHMSIHTWPEKGYAAIDIFMCGNCNVKKAVENLNRCFDPQTVNVKMHSRGEA